MADSNQTQALRRTPFYQFHIEHGGKMVDFAGWEMPLHYGSIIEEHRQVRRSGGLFDVSHMGRLRFSGRGACRFLDCVCTRRIYDMTPGQARYSIICNDQGGCRDDVLVYRLNEAEFIMVCNASNRATLQDHFNSVKAETGMVFKLSDETERTAMVAIQGPKVLETIANFSSEIPALKRYRFVEKSLIFARILISRTGYTGEDGVEVIMPAQIARKAVDLMVSSLGRGNDTIKPAGLGARDSLRLEAGMALYGHEITESIDPISAGLAFAVSLDKGEDNPEVGRFIGQEALQKIAAEGPRRKLVGLHLDGRRSARQEMIVLHHEREVGFVTSGCLSPTLGHPIAMAYLDSPLAKPGAVVQIDLGTKHADARVGALPFYKTS